MQAIITKPASRHMAASRSSGEPARPRSSADRPVVRRDAARRLIVGAVALVLGLAAVTAGLAPSAGGTNDAGPRRPRDGGVHHGASMMPPRRANPAAAQPAPRPMSWEREPAWVVLPRGNATEQRTSPHFPQYGVTLWDRLRGSSRHDARDFLLGSAIQLHAPEVAATPAPRIILPSETG